ncbi:MAG: phosphotransferase enzyme family protein [Deinococcales bacterium]
MDGIPLNNHNSPQQLEAWGQALGRLHVASTSYAPQAVLTNSGLVMPERFRLMRFWQNISPILESDVALSQIHQELGTWLESLPTTEMRLCHNDFRPANTIWDGRTAWVIDFDEPTLAHPEYDLARACLRDDCTPFTAPHFEHILRGYEQILPCKRERIATFVRLRALLMLAWDLEDPSWGTEFLELGRKLALGGLDQNGL